MIIVNKSNKDVLLKRNVYKNADQILASYGKSFHFARYFLGNKASYQSTCLYAFCRYLDDIADSENNLDKLIKIKESVTNQKKGISIHPYIDSFLELSNEAKIPKNAPIDLLSGLISDQGKVMISNEEDLIRYAYQVAGTVGLMMASILGTKNKVAIAFAIDLGIAMQLTNIARDVLEDAGNNRRYLPGSWCNNINPEEILECAEIIDEKKSADITFAINKVLLLAERYYQSGMNGLKYLSFRNHIAIGIAAIVYRLIGRKIIKKGTRWWEGREIIGLGSKIINSFLVLISLFSRLNKNPLHNVDLHIHLRDFLND